MTLGKIKSLPVQRSENMLHILVPYIRIYNQTADETKGKIRRGKY